MTKKEQDLLLKLLELVRKFDSTHVTDAGTTVFREKSQAIIQDYDSIKKK